MVAGIAAGAQLDKLKTSLQSKAVLREVFDAADVDERCENGLLEPFIYKTEHFTKTGSGQT